MRRTGTKTPIGACAAAIDRRGAMAAFGKNYPNDPIDVIIGDWMAEANMSTAAFRKQSGKASRMTFDIA